jgi:arylsulfatase A
LNPKRREVLKSVGYGAAALSMWPYLSSCKPSRKQPNIVLIMADDVGYEGFSCYGSSTYQTPNIDGLARSGIRFDRCYSTPLCTPSRVQIMTGKYNFRNYTEFGSLPQGETTFAHLLRQAGYKTCVAGKWQLIGHFEGSNYRGIGTYPNDAGFDDYCLWQVDKLGSRYWNPVLNKNGQYLENLEGKYGPDVICDHINNFVKKHRDDLFFVYYPMILSHFPFVRTPASHPSLEEQSVGDNRYFKEMVEYMDKIVGRIVDNLEKLGLREDTLVLFTADNGTMNGISSQIGNRTVNGAKGQTIDAGTHVPLMANWKGNAPEGAACDDLIDFTDFFPTLLDAAGANAPSGLKLDGQSFLSQLVGEKGNPRDWIFCHYDPRWGNFPKKRYVQNKDWKLYDDGSFFNLRADILEKNPLNRLQLNPDVQDIIKNFENVLSRMK